MIRVRLSKDEKRLLRYISHGVSYRPDGMSEAAVAACADRLEQLGFIKASWGSGHKLFAANITRHGIIYLQENPHLYNPINWAKVTAIATVVTAIIAVIALHLACSVGINT